MKSMTLDDQVRPATETDKEYLHTGMQIDLSGIRRETLRLHFCRTSGR